MTEEKLDHKIIAGIIGQDSKVLDLGCGECDLLSLLIKKKNVKAQGIELSEKAIYKCVERGVNVFHGDIESGLGWYSDKAFDYVILNHSLQEVKNVNFVINEALRVGKKVIIGFSNFAYIKARIDILFRGRTPITKSLPHKWFDTQNINSICDKARELAEYKKEKDFVFILNDYPDIAIEVGADGVHVGQDTNT